MVAHRTRHTVHDCTCTPRRPHGDQHVYQVHRCGCDACRSGYQDYLADMAQARAVGEEVYVDARPVAARLRSLQAQGVTIRAAAARTSFSASALYQVSRLARPRCRRELAEEVLALRA